MCTGWVAVVMDQAHCETAQQGLSQQYNKGAKVWSRDSSSLWIGTLMFLNAASCKIFSLVASSGICEKGSCASLWSSSCRSSCSIVRSGVNGACLKLKHAQSCDACPCVFTIVLGWNQVSLFQVVLLVPNADKWLVDTFLCHASSRAVCCAVCGTQDMHSRSSIIQMKLCYLKGVVCQQAAGFQPCSELLCSCMHVKVEDCLGAQDCIKRTRGVSNLYIALQE